MNKKLLLLVFSVAIVLLAWSVLSSAAIKMNEVYSQGTKNNTAPDWIELYNDTNAPVDISGYMIYDPGAKPPSVKPKKTLPAGSVIPAYGFFAIATDYTTDTASDFGLGSGGDEAWLEDATSTVIDYVLIPAMKVGQSYQRIPDGGTWKLAKPLTRGSSNVVVKMNEIYSAGTSDNPDWIELYNNSADTVDVSGYKIYDSGAVPPGTKAKKKVPAGTVLMPKSWYVIVTDKTTDTATDFGLSGSGEKVWLEDSSGVVVDSVAFVAMVAGESYSRVPDAGTWQKTSNVTRGTSNGPSTGVEEHEALATEYKLLQNYPNPFNPTTQIEFMLPKASKVQMTVHNLLGQMVREVVNTQMAAGVHQVTVDAADLQSGVYFYTIRTADFTATKRMVVMK
jgi:hypothetical protein